MRHLFILLTALAGFASAPLSQADTRPNIVFMIADDLAWDDLGCSGNPKVRTPHLDRLAKGGMQFPNAFLTISSCSPSRRPGQTQAKAAAKSPPPPKSLMGCASCSPRASHSLGLTRR